MTAPEREMGSSDVQGGGQSRELWDCARTFEAAGI
jgi:hypothetical protein